MLEAARQIAEHVRAFPRAGKRRLQRKRDELQMRLASAVPRGHPLYARLFAEQQLVDEYVARVIAVRNERRQQEASRRRAEGDVKFASWHEYQSAKYGVVWEDDKDVRECRECARPFTLLRRRHHCRSCGKIVCDACSKARGVVLARGDEKPKRVCDTCVAAQRPAAADGAAAGPAVAPASDAATANV